MALTLRRAPGALKGHCLCCAWGRLALLCIRLVLAWFFPLQWPTGARPAQPSFCPKSHTAPHTALHSSRGPGCGPRLSETSFFPRSCRPCGLGLQRVHVRVHPCESAGRGLGSSPLAGKPTDTPGSVSTPLLRPTAQGNDETSCQAADTPRRASSVGTGCRSGGWNLLWTLGVDPIRPNSQAKAVDKARSQSGCPFGFNSALPSKARQERTSPILQESGKVGGSCPLAPLLPRWAHPPL